MPKGNMSNLIIWISERAPERLHQLCAHRLDVLVQEVGLQVVNA